VQISEHYWWVPLVVIFGGLLSATLILLVRKKIVAGVLLGAATFLMVAISVPSLKPGRPQAQLNACNANLKQINGAIDQWCKENTKVKGDKIDVASVAAYLKGGHMPTCPRGGFYSFSAVGRPPECSLPEHANAAQ
jgi:hypothetical protein